MYTVPTFITVFAQVVGTANLQDCGNTYSAENLQSALTAGLLNTTDLDRAVGRAMRMRMRAGALHMTHTFV